MDRPEIGWRWRGRMPYGLALEEQRAWREAILREQAPEQIWLLEHDPVVTLGRREAPGTPSAEALALRGIERFVVERGGLATFHGPGQLVAYLLVDAAGRGLGVKGFISAIEDGIIAFLAEQGLGGHRRQGYPGVWVGRDKIAALGLHFRRGVSLHGLALNLHTDLSAFDLIVPCGITDGGVTSLERIAGSSPSPEEAAPALARCLLDAIDSGQRNP